MMRGLYIHIPFCSAKCPYCAFYSETDKDEGLVDRYSEALIKDLESRDNLSFDTAYIGGGTPSSIKPKKLDNLLSEVFKRVSSDKIKEFTVEANPESLSEDFLKVCKDYGVTRLSIGCQSTDNDILKLLGRIHDYDDFVKAYELVRNVMPDADINADLIFDIPEVPFEIIQDSFEKMVALEPEHVSAYSYSYDTGYLEDREKNQSPDQFMFAKYFLEQRGYEKYETSNFAKEGHKCMHNLIYWNLDDYEGIGASAYSLNNLDEKRVVKGKFKDIKLYMSDPLGFVEEMETEGDDLIKEKIVFGLRMLEGVNMPQLEKEYGAVSRELKMKIQSLINDGALEWKKENLCVTQQGELLLDSVSEFLW